MPKLFCSWTPLVIRAVAHLGLVRPTAMHEVNVTIRNADKESPKSRLDRAQQIAQVFSLFALPLIVAIGGWWIQRSIATADIEQKYVELALSILREPPKATDKSLRIWSARHSRNTPR